MFIQEAIITLSWLILKNTDNKEIDLKLFILSVSTSLMSGITTADLRTFGNTPLEKLKLNMNEKTGDAISLLTKQNWLNVAQANYTNIIINYYKNIDGNVSFIACKRLLVLIFH